MAAIGLAVALEIIVGISVFVAKFLTDSIRQEFILLDLMDIATRHKPEIGMAARHGANSFTQRRPRFRST